MYLEKAILKLRPNAEFAINADDYATIKWFVLTGKAPTQPEIDAAVEQIKAGEITEAKAQATAKTTAQAKLAALGLTVEDLQALGL